MIETALDMFELIPGDLGEVRFFRQESSGQADAIFHGPLFPTMERLAEVRFGSQDLVDPLMLCVLRTVVVSDGASHLARVSAQSSGNGFCDLDTGVTGQLGQVHISA